MAGLLFVGIAVPEQSAFTPRRAAAQQAHGQP